MQSNGSYSIFLSIINFDFNWLPKIVTVLDLAAKIPKEFSIVRLARDRR